MSALAAAEEEGEGEEIFEGMWTLDEGLPTATTAEQVRVCMSVYGCIYVCVCGCIYVYVYLCLCLCLCLSPAVH
jgi:hypothetical protein